MTKRIRKAVFPVAGLGTRFLPATKAVPKEMLTVVDRPVVQHVVDEAREAGIEHFVFVTGRGKAVIEDHFDMSYELEDTLRQRGKIKEYEALMADLPAAGATSFTRQQAPLGLGHAVWCARDIIGDEPFAVLLPDMITLGNGPAEVAAASRRRSRPMRTHGGNIIAVEEVPPEETHQYGVVGSARITATASRSPTWWRSRRRERRRAISSSPAAIFCSPEIFDILEKGEKGAGGEIQLTDAMMTLAKKQAFHGVRFDGKTYDTGSKFGFLAANIAFGLERPDIRRGLRAEIAKLLG